MFKTSNFTRVFGISLAVFGILLIAGLTNAAAQGRDPFAKPGYARSRDQVKAGMKIGKDGKPIMEDWSVPPIDARIDYYKRMRAAAAESGVPIPKVTSVLTLNEMSVTGIFRTPRGYAAMVEATPIKLSYTIYPGEKFFDGQLVAVEENQLIFRKVTKTGKDKFVSSVVNMPLKKFTDRQQIEGTATVTQAVAASQTMTNGQPAPVKIVSPVDEMNSQPAAPDNKSGKTEKKPVKVARKN
jgi:hypothetical protein